MADISESPPMLLARLKKLLKVQLSDSVATTKSIKEIEGSIKSLATRNNLSRGEVFRYHGEYFAIRTGESYTSLVDGVLEHYTIHDLTNAV